MATDAAEALALDASDGVLDGKFYGAKILTGSSSQHSGQPVPTQVPILG